MFGTADNLVVGPTPARRQRSWCRWCLWLAVCAAGALVARPAAAAGAAVHLTAEEHSWLAEHRDRLTLYFNTEFPPIEFVSQAGTFVGLGADVIAQVEHLLGVTFQKTPCADWNRHLAALRSGECAIAPTIVRTQEREAFAFFTAPYATVPVVIIATRALPDRLTLSDLAGRRVGVVSGFATETHLRDQALLTRFEVVPADNVPAGLQAVSFGQTDAFAENLAVAAWYIDRNGIPNLRVAGTTDYSFAWSIGVSRRYPLLYSAVVKALEALPERDLVVLRKRWISLQPAPGLSAEMARALGLAGVFAGLLLAGLTAIALLLKHRLARNTDDLRRSEARYRELVECANSIILRMDHDGQITYVNDYAQSFFGYRADDVIGRNVVGTIVPETDSAGSDLRAMIADIGRQPERYATNENENMRRDGTRVWVAWTNRPLYDPAGTVTEILCVGNDVTARRHAEEALRQEATRRQRQAEVIAAVAASHSLAEGAVWELAAELTAAASYALQVERVGVWLFDEHQTRLTSLDNYCASTGTHSSGSALTQEAFGDELAVLRHAHYVDAHDALTDPRTAGYVETYLIPNRITSMLDAAIRAEGRNLGTLCFEHVDQPHHWQDDEISFACRLADQVALAILHSERRRAEEAQREGENRFRLLVHNSSDIVQVMDEHGIPSYISDPIRRILGYRPEERVGISCLDDVHPDDLPTVLAVLGAARAHPGTVLSVEYRYRHRDGHWVHLEAIGCSLLDDPSVRGIILNIRDTTERKQSEEALREKTALLEAQVDATLDGILVVDPQHRRVLTNQRIVELLQVPPDIQQDDDDTRLLSHVVSLVKEPEQFLARIHYLYEHTNECSRDEVELLNGMVLDRYSAPVFAPDGRYYGRIWTFRDITERRRAEQERERLREQLTQAQKMESIGRLAGGVAHDFNNMLGVILGRTEMAMEQVDPAEPLADDLQEIIKAAERSADLTRQLLAFARRQTVAPRVLDLNETIEGMLKMLRRLIGENIDLAWLPGKGLGSVRMDPSQVDQILANLCVNARDAIGDTGQVTIETAAVVIDDTNLVDYAAHRPGDYLVLAVTDNGCGMAPETLAYVFEPFYTTKETGRGTGLGLATVYGIVTQNDGFIDVSSEPGRGTTFRLYLPRHTAPAAPPRPEETDRPAPRGHETILLVEDEPSILNMTTLMLRRQGYTVLPAATPGAASALAAEHNGAIDLLMTDVVMPEMNGSDLASSLAERYPGLKCLFMSGYTSSMIARHGVLDEGVHFIQKPFTMHSLGTKVREALQGTAEP